MNIRDQVIPILALLQATEGHLGARDVLLWVLEVCELVVLMIVVGTVLWTVLLEYPPSTRYPSACWHRYTRSPQPVQSFDRTGRVGLDQSCCPRILRLSGIERISS